MTPTGSPRGAPGRGEGDGQRFLFYSHDGYGLGHLSRNLMIAGALHELGPRASVLVASSADGLEAMGLPPNVDVLKLPAIEKVDNHSYAARRLAIPPAQIHDLRAKVLSAAVESFRPAVILSDRHALGVGGELLPALESVRAVGGRAVLGLRDVLDEPAVVRAEWAAGGLFDRVPRYYDRVLVYGQRDVFDPVALYALPEPVARMTFFCGYVFRLPVTQHRDPGEGLGRVAPGDKPLVLATTGGGGDGFGLLSRFLEAAEGQRWEAIVVSGPQCPEADRRRLAEFAGEVGAQHRTFVPGIAAELASVDALVCMGGYNTLVEAVASASPTVCVPRIRPRREQFLRARAFAELGLLRYIDPERLSTAWLREEVLSALSVPRDDLRRASRALDIDGARRTALHLLEVAAGRDAAPDAEPRTGR